MSINTLRDRLQRIKNYAKHSPTELMSTSIVSFVGAALNVGLAPGNSAIALFWVTGLGMAAAATTANVNNSLTSPFGGLFTNKRRGKKAMLQALRSMQELQFPDPAQAFEHTLKVLNGLQRQYQTPHNGGPGQAVTLPGGYVFEGVLPDDPAQACEVLVKHAVYLTLTKGSCQPDGDDFLSQPLQRLILTQHPDWLALAPYLFDPDITQDVHPGLHDALVCIRALDYTGDEQSHAIRTWLDSQCRNQKDVAVLPEGLVY